LRLLEIIISEDRKPEYDALFEDDETIVERWTAQTDNGQLILKILTQDEHAKELLTALDKKYGYQRVIIYPVEGTLPKVDEPQPKEEEKLTIGKFISISKEELYDDVYQPANLSINFILMVVLSAFVAGIGILKDNVAVIIGAMVIAPFLGPNMSMAFGTTLGDLKIIRKSITTGLVATITALGISVIWGLFANEVGRITADATIEYQDIILALVCGFAGVISVLSGQGSSLVGVMVAAALLPPLMRAGLFLGGAHFGEALNSFLIFSTNIICLNIAGIITFYLTGIRPNRWWEQEQAKKQTRFAFILWLSAFLVILAAVMMLKQYGVGS